MPPSPAPMIVTVVAFTGWLMRGSLQRSPVCRTGTTFARSAGHAIAAGHSRAAETLEDCLGLFSARETGHGLVCPAHGCRWYQGKMRLEQRTGPVVHPATRRLLRPGEPGVLRLFRHQARPIADGAEVRPSKREADLQGTRGPGESPRPGRLPRRATSTM